jgi:pimeloyl-ACP methyl ester carboxylesterase
MRRLLTVAAVALVAGSATAAYAHPTHPAASLVTCREYAGIPVALAPKQPARYTVGGELCATPAEQRTGAIVQVLVHGATYNHTYWDFGKVDGVEYSYARDVAARGIATFAIDLLGSGKSAHPASTLLTAQAEAYVTHQIVQKLRHGAITGARFGKVISVGHSLGSTVVWQEAISYGDVDGVIVTGAAHAITSRFQAFAATAFYPATHDPRFAGSRLDPGYLTAVPRAHAAFYSAPDADAAVIATDDARKDVVPATELVTGVSLVTSRATLAIQVPVLDILGGDDMPTCGATPHGGRFDCSSGAAVVAQEAPYYSPRAQLQACVVPGAGHDLSLALNHELQVRDAVAWSTAYVDHQGNGLPRYCS